MAIVLDIDGIDPTVLAMEKMANMDVKQLQHRVAVTSQSAVEARILTEKRSPNGLRWAPWSSAYASTRRSGHSLLIDTGDLSESMEISQSGLITDMGTSVKYAKKNDTEREFMGLSAGDEANVERAIHEWMEEVFV